MTDSKDSKMSVSSLASPQATQPQVCQAQPQSGMMCVFANEIHMNMGVYQVRGISDQILAVTGIPRDKFGEYDLRITVDVSDIGAATAFMYEKLENYHYNKMNNYFSIDLDTLKGYLEECEKTYHK